METIESLVSLVVAVCYLIGIVTFILGLVGFKNYASNPQQYPLSNNIMCLLVGSFLLSLPVVYSVLKRSTVDSRWNESSPLSIAPHVEDVDLSGSFFGRYLPEHTAQSILAFIYLVGLLAFVNGILKLKRVGLGHVGGGGGSIMPSALTHIFGGVFVMNIVDVSCFIAETVGMESLCMR